MGDVGATNAPSALVRAARGAEKTARDDAQSWRRSTAMLVIPVMVTLWWRASSTPCDYWSMRAARNATKGRRETCQARVRVGYLDAGCGMMDHVIAGEEDRKSTESFLIARALGELAWKIGERLGIPSGRRGRTVMADSGSVRIAETDHDEFDRVRDGMAHIVVLADASVRLTAVPDAPPDLVRRRRWPGSVPTHCELKLRVGDLRVDRDMWDYVGRHEADRRDMEEFMVAVCAHHLMRREVTSRLKML